MDAKLIRSAIYSSLVFLLCGLGLRGYGGWNPIFELTGNIFGSFLIIVIFSIALGFIYSKWFANFLPGTTLIKGALFGILVWAIFLILGGVADFFKDSVYPRDEISLIFLALVLHSIWGSALTLFLDSKS